MVPSGLAVGIFGSIVADLDHFYKNVGAPGEVLTLDAHSKAVGSNPGFKLAGFAKIFSPADPIPAKPTNLFRIVPHSD